MDRLLVVSALLLLPLAGCTQQQELQSRIEALETRIVELEAQQAQWPFEIANAEQQGDTDTPWWDPAPIYKRDRFKFGAYAEYWVIPGFQLNLSNETVKRLNLGPAYGDAAAVDPVLEWRRLIFRGWNRTYGDADHSVLAPIMPDDGYHAIYTWHDLITAQQIIYAERITSALIYAPNNFPWVWMPYDDHFSEYQECQP